ncbi:MAG: HAD family phosphatase [Muribaculaceae bacterium]|nr:HAD family phosphatase [Muribaculaceae bacterium]
MVRNLMFDLGGVIMDIERERCVRSFKRLGMKEPEKFLGDYGQTGAFGALEEGLITPDEFHARLRPLLDEGVTDAQIDAAFNDFLVGIPTERLQALRELRKRYRLYLLSNTNAVMWNSRIAFDFRAEGLEREDYFDGLATSFEARSLKPSPEIFEYTVRKFGIRPEETVFLDDSAANVEAARRLGFGGLVVPPGREFTDILKEGGL